MRDFGGEAEALVTRVRDNLTKFSILVQCRIASRFEYSVQGNCWKSHVTIGERRSHRDSGNPPFNLLGPIWIQWFSSIPLHR